MNIADQYDLCRYGTMKLPKLKGSVRVVLKDKKTGRIDREIRGSNIVTNAVADIFANNMLGAISTSSMLPLYQKWYGGILGYKQAHADETNPADYFIKGNDVQELIGFAGDVNPSTAQLAEDKRRGRKISETSATNAYEQTFEWGSEEGNGVWSAVSLCHKDLGNASTGSTSSTFAAFEPFASIGNLSNITPQINSVDNIFAKYDDNHGIWFHIGDESEFYSGHTNFQTKKLTIIIKRLPLGKVGLFETMNALSTKQRVFVVELTNNLYLQPSWYFDYANKKLWVFNNITSTTNYSASYNSSVINYAIIDCENEEVDSEGTITSDTSDIAPLSMCHIPQAGWKDMFINANILKDGNYLYFPTTNGVDWGEASRRDFGQNVKGLKKINFSDTSDQSDITFNAAQKHFRNSIINGGIIINGGRVINGGIGYSCANNYLSDFSESVGYNTFAGVWAFSNPNQISSYVVPIGSGNHSSPTSLSRYILANKMVNTTIFNLKDSQQQPTSFAKDNTKLLQITYTLTETSS